MQVAMIQVRAVCLAFSLSWLLSAAVGAAEVATKGIVLIRFEGEINALREAYFRRKLELARELAPSVVVAEIESPGGRVDSSLKLAEMLRDANWATTVAYVPKEAISGAAIMSLGCDQILMRDKARIGDAGVIFMDENFLFRHAPEKVRSDLVRQVRDLASEHGKPPAIAEAMVDMDLEVFKVTQVDTGEKSYMSDAELEALDDPTEWQKGALLEPSKRGSFLELNGQQAVEVGLADGIANSRAAVAARFDRQADDIVVLEMTWVDTMVLVLNSWPVTILLFIIGLIALYVELAAPGMGVGGLIAGLCFLLFFWSRFLGGTAGWLEVVLFLGGVAFLIVELFVIPGFGVAGVAGVLLLITSLLMASQRFAAVDGISITDLSQSALLISGAMVGSLIGMFVLAKYFNTIPVFKQLLLEPPVVVAAAPGLAADNSGSPVETAAALQIGIGDEGVADSPLRPAGRVLFGEQFRDVVTDGSFVDKGARVRVIQISGTHITVREIS